MAHLGPNWNDIFVKLPPGMLETVLNALAELNSKGRGYYEEFSELVDLPIEKLSVDQNLVVSNRRAISDPKLKAWGRNRNNTLRRFVEICMKSNELKWMLKSLQNKGPEGRQLYEFITKNETYRGQLDAAEEPPREEEVSLETLVRDMEQMKKDLKSLTEDMEKRFELLEAKFSGSTSESKKRKIIEVESILPGLSAKKCANCGDDAKFKAPVIKQNDKVLHIPICSRMCLKKFIIGE